MQCYSVSQAVAEQMQLLLSSTAEQGTSNSKLMSAAVGRQQAGRQQQSLHGALINYTTLVAFCVLRNKWITP